MSFGGLGKLSLVLAAVDKASPVIQKVRGEVSQLGKEEKKQAAESMLLGGALTAVGVAGLYAAGKFAQSAASVESLRKAFNALTKSSSLSLEALQEAARGTISELDLLRAANTAMMLSIDPTALPEMMEIARQSAVAMGIDTSFAFLSIAQGVGRQSKLILDNLGIVFDANNAYKEFSESIGKTVDELTDAERRQAYLNKTLEVGRKHIEELGDVTGGATEVYQQFKAAMDDFQATVGEQVLPVITSLLSVLKGLFDWFNSLPRPMKSLIVAAGLVGAALAVLGGAFLLLGGTAGIAAKALIVFHALTGPTGWAVLALAAAMTAASYIWIDSVLNMKEATKDFSDGAGDAFKGISRDARSYVDTTLSTLKTGLIEDAQNLVERFNKCVGGKGYDLSQDYTGSMEELVDNTTNLIKSGLLGQAQANMAAYAECTTGKQADMVDQIDEYLDELYDEYMDNTNKIVSYRKQGLDDEADLYERKNDEILEKMRQFEEWKEILVTQTQDDVNAHLKEQLKENLKIWHEYYREWLADFIAGPVGQAQIARGAGLEEFWRSHPEWASGLPVEGKQAGGWVGLHGPELALVGEKEPELITPLSQLKKGGGMGSPIYNLSATATVHVHGDIRNEADENRLARKIAQAQLDETRAQWR